MNENRAVIVGAGPAGLTCATYLARAGWQVDVYSGESTSLSCLAEAPLVMNYPGFPDGIDGLSLLELFTEQARKSGAVIHPESIVSIDTSSRTVTDDAGAVAGYDKVVVASGVKPRRFSCDGIERIPVHTCAICDGGMYGRDDAVVVIGGGDTAVNSALYLSGIVGKVLVVVRKSYFRATNRKAVYELAGRKNVTILHNRSIVAVSDDGRDVPKTHGVRRLKLDDGSEIEACAIFSCIGFDVNDIPVIGDGKVWSCGDCVETHRQIAVAVGSGAKTALDIIGGR